MNEHEPSSNSIYMDSPPRSEVRDWGAVAIAASARLASCVRFHPYLPVVLQSLWRIYGNVKSRTEIRSGNHESRSDFQT